MGHIPLQIDTEIIKAILVYVVPLTIGGIASILSVQMDTLFVGKFYSVEDFAVYSAVSKELPVTALTASFTFVLMPMAVRFYSTHKYDDLVKVWDKCNQISIIILCFCTSILFVFSKEVVTVLYSEKYVSGTVIFQIYLITILIKFTYYGMVLNIAGKTKRIMAYSIITIALNFIFNIILGRMFGTVGYALATVLSNLIMSVQQLLDTCKILKKNLLELFSWTKYIKIMIVNITLAAVFLLVRYFVVSMSISLYIYIPVIFLLWSCLYYFIMKNKLTFLRKQLKGVEIN